MDWKSRGPIALIGTLDTKGEEILFLKQRLSALGAHVLVIDVGVLGAPAFEPDVSREEIAASAGVRLEELVFERDRGKAIAAMERGLAAPHFALVLDIVMNEEGVVQKLDRHGRAHRVRRPGPERARGRDADARAHHLSASPRIVGRKVVEVGTRFAGRQIGLHGAQNFEPALLQEFGYERRSREAGIFVRIPVSTAAFLQGPGR